MLKCKAGKLVETIWPLVKADIPVFIQGPSGVGKSAMIRNALMPLVRKEYGDSVLHDYRLSSKDITDGTGIPIVDQDSKATLWTRPAFIPVDDGKMHVLFLDEVGHASVQMQHAVGYQLVWDRGLGEYKLPKKNRVILAYNTKADKGGDNKLAKPFENRGAHVLVEVDQAGWLAWGNENGIDPRLLAFQKVRPELLHRMDENNPAWPSPRAIENLNRVFKDKSNNRTHIENAAIALCGEGYAAQLVSFLRDLDASLPKLSEIKANPSGAKVPSELAHQGMVASSIAHQIADTGSDIDTWVTYLKRLPPDIASHAAHTAMEKNKDVASNSKLKKLILD